MTTIALHPRQSEPAPDPAPTAALTSVPAIEVTGELAAERGTGSRSTRTERIVDALRAASARGERTALVHELIETNVPVARSIATRYAHRGIDLDDLQQVALVGLIKAAQRFDPATGHDFLVFAVPTIRGELRRHFRDSGWMIRVPRRVQELQARIKADQLRLHARLGRAPRATELAEHLGAELGDVVEALAAEDCFRPTSLELSVGDGTGTLADLLGWEDPGLSSVEARLALGTAVADLTEREQQILRWRFVDERTQQEIADLAGVTQAQVSRILTRVLTRLRTSLTDSAPGPTTEPVPAA